MPTLAQLKRKARERGLEVDDHKPSMSIVLEPPPGYLFGGLHYIEYEYDDAGRASREFRKEAIDMAYDDVTDQGMVLEPCDRPDCDLCG